LSAEQRVSELVDCCRREWSVVEVFLAINISLDVIKSRSKLCSQLLNAVRGLDVYV